MVLRSLLIVAYLAEIIILALLALIPHMLNGRNLADIAVVIIETQLITNTCLINIFVSIGFS